MVIGWIVPRYALLYVRLMLPLLHGAILKRYAAIEFDRLIVTTAFHAGELSGNVFLASSKFDIPLTGNHIDVVSGMGQARSHPTYQGATNGSSARSG